MPYVTSHMSVSRQDGKILTFIQSGQILVLTIIFIVFNLIFMGVLRQQEGLKLFILDKFKSFYYIFILFYFTLFFQPHPQSFYL